MRADDAWQERRCQRRHHVGHCSGLDVFEKAEWPWFGTPVFILFLGQQV